MTRLLSQKEKAEEEKKIVVENINEWKSVVNRIFSSPDGRLMAKYMLRHNRLFSVDSTFDAAKILKLNGRKEFYLDLVRPYLEPATIAGLENQK